MRCSYCDKKAVICLRYIKKRLCNEHFVRMTEKRMRNAVRQHNMIKKNERIFVEHTGPHAAALLFALNELKKDLPFIIVAQRKDADKTASSESIDDLAESVLGKISGKRGNVLHFTEKKVIRPLLGIPKEELLLYAKSNMIKEKKEQHTKKKSALDVRKFQDLRTASGRRPLERQIAKLLEKMEKRHPGIRFQIMKSAMEIKVIEETPQ